MGSRGKKKRQVAAISRYVRYRLDLLLLLDFDFDLPLLPSSELSESYPLLLLRDADLLLLLPPFPIDL